MGRTWTKRKGSKKPKKPLVLLALLLLLLSFPAQAADMPKAGDMALGGSLSLTNTLPDDSCKNVPGPAVHCHGTTVEQCDTEYPMEPGIGLSFEMWADEHWSYQAGVSFAHEGSPSAYSASAWHAPIGKGAGFFGSIGLAAASGTGIMSDAGAGFEFYSGKVNVQLRGDWYYDLNQASDDNQSSYGLGLAIRKKW